MAYIPRKGVKRKYEEEEEAHHAWQRKSVIDMSMGKLRNNVSLRHEPCLRRSVLILNTLKYIESELAQEGVDTHQSTEAAMNEIPEMSMAQLTLDPLPDMSTFICPLPASSSLSFPLQSTTGMEDDSSNYFALVDSAVVDLLPCKSQLGCQNLVLPQTSSLEHCSALLPGGDFSSSGCYNPVSPLPQTSALYHSSSVPDTLLSPMCYNTLSSNSVAELPNKGYEDEDLNNNLAAQGPYSYNASSNTVLEEECLSEAEVMEFLHSLQEVSDSTASTGTSSSSSTSSSSVLNAQCSTYCRSDSTLDDLDSIMQILVGM